MKERIGNLKINILSLILMMALIVAMRSMSVFASESTIVKSGTCGDNITWTLDDAGTLTISGTGAMKDYTYASKAPWYPVYATVKTVVIENGVTGIGDLAFMDCYISSAAIPNSVTSIGRNAFLGCDYLKSITIPDSVTSIDEGAFKYSQLTSVTIGSGVTSIGENAFDCFNLTSVYIKDIEAWCSIDFSNQLSNPLNTADNLYLNGKLVTSLIIPDSVTSIGNYSFYDCDSLSSVTTGNGVTNIGNYAFYNCDNLTTTTIGSGVTRIGFYTFYDCDSLTTITIPDSVSSIGDFAFMHCVNLNSVTIGQGVTDIRYGAFYDCDSINSIIIPDSVTNIGESAFYDCNRLTSVTIGNSVTSIGNSAFRYCSKIKYVFYNSTNADRNNIVIGYNNSVLEDVEWHYETIDHIKSNWITDTSATCTKDGVKHIECTVCAETIKSSKIEASGHNYETITADATLSANGSILEKCSNCGGVKSSKTIYMISSVSLSATAYTYNGEKKTPTVTVKDSKGNKLVKDEDYSVKYSSSSRKSIGRYSVKVTFKGDYTGSKTLYFTIGPKNPTSVTAKLYGYDDVKVTWKKVSGASGYKVYYKKSTSSTWSSKTTTGTSIKLANLSDGVKYNIKVVTYKTVNGNKCYNVGKSTSIYTLKKVAGVKVAKSGSKVKVSWTNISGETGYQISKSTSKSGTNIVATYKTTSGNSKSILATEGKTYYYKVRAYKVVDGKKVYGPWSSVVKYKR